MGNHFREGEERAFQARRDYKRSRGAVILFVCSGVNPPATPNARPRTAGPRARNHTVEPSPYGGEWDEPGPINNPNRPSSRSRADGAYAPWCERRWRRSSHEGFRSAACDQTVADRKSSSSPRRLGAFNPGQAPSRPESALGRPVRAAACMNEIPARCPDEQHSRTPTVPRP